MRRKKFPECGANRKHGAGPCRKPQGWGTDHPGQGRCKLHGGKTPIKHGRYSEIKRPALRALIEKFSQDPDPLNLLPEVITLRAMFVDLINRFDDIYGPDGALLAWHESFLLPSAQLSPKPRQMIDISSLRAMAAEVGNMVDRIQKYRNEGVVTMDTLNRVMEQMGVEAVGAIQAAEIDAVTRTKLFNDIESRWGTIRLDTLNKSSDKRST
jgi:hypothetical protein